ncbi:M16 family metallopeptidase [Candidatus Margulisiibacteriota bacterium]
MTISKQQTARCAYSFIVLAVSCLLLAGSCNASPPEKYILDNGLTLILQENRGNGLFAATVFIKAGSINETEKNAGIAALVANMLYKGTKRSSAEAIAEELEFIGAKLGVQSTTDYTEISYLSLSKDAEKGLRIIGDILNNANFPKAELEKTRHNKISAIKEVDDHPNSLIYNKITELLYRNHPYGFSSKKIIRTLQNCTRADLLDFYHNYYTPDNIVVSIAGDISKYDAYQLCKKNLKFNRKSVKRIISKMPLNLPGSREKTIKKSDLKANWIEIGYLAPKIDDPDYAAMKVLSSILGAGMSSRLFVEIREKNSLVYSIHSYFPSRLQKSHFIIHAVTGPDNLKKVKTRVFEEINKLKKITITEAELNHHKSALKGKLLISRQNINQKAWQSGWFCLMGLGFDMQQHFNSMIDSVTANDIKSVANRYFQNNCAIIIKSL